MFDFPHNPVLKADCIAFAIEPNAYGHQQLIKEANKNDSPYEAALKQQMGVTTVNLSAPNNPLRDKRYLILACFENAPGAEKKVFDAMNEIFCDIAAGVENDWTLTEAAQKMQELLAERTDVVCRCVPMETVDVF